MDNRILFFMGLASAMGLAAAGCAGDDSKSPAVDAGLAADASLDAKACGDDVCGEHSPDAAGNGDGDDDAAVSAAPSSVGSCCEAQPTAGCEAPEIEACVCALDRLCCTGAWDARCVELVDLQGCGWCGPAPSSVCEVQEASDVVPGALHGTLGGGEANDAVELSCGAFAEPELLFAFTAPEAGNYSFSTAGSEVFDTVLAVIDGSACDGDELACNDDDDGELSSRVTVELTAGQEVLIAIEGWGDESGEIQMAIDAEAGSAGLEPGLCAPAELSATLPASVSGESNAEGDLLTPSCALFGSAGEALYRFTAEQDARYRFDTRGSVADTIVQVLDGSDCTGVELACNDDSDLGGLSAITEMDLATGQTVLVNVDSLDGVGSYTLTVERVDPALEVPVTGSPDE